MVELCTGKGYSLRAGTEVKTNNTASDSAVKAEISWVKGDGANIEAEVLPVETPEKNEDYDAPTEDEHEMPALEETQPEPEPEQVEEMPPPLEEGQPEHESSPVQNQFLNQCQTRTRKSRSLFLLQKVMRSDEDDEDDEDDEKVETDHEEYKGITYYVDTDNDVMTEDGEVVGKRRKKKDGTFTLDEY